MDKYLAPESFIGERPPFPGNPNVPTVLETVARLIFVAGATVETGISVEQANFIWSDKPQQNTLSNLGRDEYLRRAKKLILLMAEQHIYLSR